MSKENHIGIRYSKDGDIETYDTRTGKTTGHISTMGNMIEETQEDRERYEKEWEEAMKKHGYVYHRRRTKQQSSKTTLNIYNKKNNTFLIKTRIFLRVFSFQPNYKGMRIITDELYAALIAHLAKDEKVSLFQKLLLSKQAEDNDTPSSETLESENERSAE